MPGWLVHTAVFKKHDNNVLGVIIPDFLPFLKQFDFYQTHDLTKAIQFKRYLKKVDKSSLWLAKGWISHIVLDQAAEKNKKLSKQRSLLNKKIIPLISNHAKEDDEFISDLVLDIVMDSLIRKEKRLLPSIIETSIHKTNMSLISKHIANFWGGEEKEIHNKLEYLKSVDFNKITASLHNASHAYLQFYGFKKKGFLTKMYGLYINRIMNKHKDEIKHIICNSEEFFMEEQGKNTNLQEILEHLKQDHHITFNQKFYIPKKQDSSI